MKLSNKLIILFVIILLAAGGVVLMEVISKPDSTSPATGAAATTPEADIRDKIDSLSLGLWNENDYLNIVSRINNFSNQGVLAPATVDVLKKDLNTAYVGTMLNSYDKWKKGGCVQAVPGMEDAMRQFIGQYPQFRPNLGPMLSSFEKVRSVGMFASQVDALLGQRYQDSTYTSLYNEISNFTNDANISQCTVVKQIRQVELARLNDFRNFVQKYTDAHKLYTSNPDVWAFAKDYASFCRDTELDKYSWYKWHFNSQYNCPLSIPR